MMKKMQWGLAALTWLTLSYGPVRGQDSLELHFRRPPAAFSLLPFWSWNNTLDSTRLNWQMDQMMDKGIYGAFMHARAGLDSSATPYFSDGWWRAVESTVRHAHDRGFLSCLYDEDGWPSGSAGGRTLAADPERYIKKVLRYRRMEVEGPQDLRLDFAGHALAIYAGRISDKGVYDFSSQQDLTALGGKKWAMPAGRWAITVFTLVKDPGKQIDYLDSSAVAQFLHITHDEYYRRLSPYFGGTIPGVFFDEIYANLQDRQNNIVWTDDFAEQFRKRKGYDIVKRLPLLLYDDPRWTFPVRYDFFEVARDLYNRAWFRQYAKWAADHHIWVTGHTTEEMANYIRQMDYFNTMGQLQRPCTDNEDFRYGFPRQIDWYDPKQMSSIGHTYGSERVAAESMGSGGYAILPEEYRYGFSMLGVYGINMFVPHLFHYSTARPENQADWPPSWFYENPYWKYFRPLADFAARISFMGARGKHVCRVAMTYPTTQLWLNGYSGGVDDSYYKEVQRQLLENHIDYDIVDPESLAKAGTGSEGLEIGAERYKILILPDLKAVRSDVMSKIDAFVAGGGILIGLKGLPSFSEKGGGADPAVANSMTEIFGIAPGDLRPAQYYSWDKERKHNYIEHTKDNGKGIFTRDADALPEIIRGQIKPDILVEGEGNAWLQYQHRKVGDRDIYFLVNSRREADTFRVSLGETGRPYCWDPETGDIRELTNYRVHEGRLELFLPFKPWQACFIVLEPGAVRDRDVLVEAPDLDDMQVSGEGGRLMVKGWSAGGDHRLTLIKGKECFHQTWKGVDVPAEIALDGAWSFQLSPHALDQRWSSSLDADTLEMPVMDFSMDAGDGMSRGMEEKWKTIKVKDAFSPARGASRYASGWSGAWISYYENGRHLPDIGGGDAWFRKELMTGGAIKDASLDITADAAYELYINGRHAGSGEDWRRPAHYRIDTFLSRGKNVILVKVTGLRGLLMEGAVRLASGQTIPFRTDSSWQTSRDQIGWMPAFQYAAPPLGPWGNITRPGHDLHFPCTVWYRQSLPPGTVSVIRPEIKGGFEVYIDGRRVSFGGGDKADVRGLLKDGKGMLTIKVRLNRQEDGLQDPLKVVCGKAFRSLQPWSDMGLGWYSGRALYTKKVTVPASYVNEHTKMMLDLGRVDYFAEVWVNGRLVSYHPWPPFRADITAYVHSGENEVTVIVADLLANKASWDLLDANISNNAARWWNTGSILREKDRLTAGLLGPVRIVPYVRDSVECVVKEDVVRSAPVKPSRPDIVLIVADDMGFSDIGCYGGEIHTPNIDRLAKSGIRFTRMYNNAWCSPSRASLLTGLFPHQAGMAVLAGPNPGPPGPYEGYLNDSCVTLAEVLRQAGYRTALAGKWHLGEARPHWPVDRGFDHYFGLISGASNYFDMTKDKSPHITRHMALDGNPYTPPKEGFYMTDAITRYAVDVLTDTDTGRQPLFLYVAYTAPHWPLQALPEDIKKYKGKYSIGWDSLRDQRYTRQRTMGLWKEGVALSPRDEEVHSWQSLTAAQRDSMALKMAVYAAQVDRMDQGIGRILDQIKASGREDSTIVIFLSDNGGCAEGGIEGFDKRGNGLPPGGVDSYMSYGQSWANASNTPFRYFKKWLHEGGISTPFIVRWPTGIARERDGGFISQTGHLTDLMPTLCDAAGAKYPERYRGRFIRGAEGQSLLPAIEDGTVQTHKPLYWELNGHKAILLGNYKLVSAGKGTPWELYDVVKDRTELNDLAGKDPGRVRRLAALWEAWAARVGVVDDPPKSKDE